MAKLMPSPVTGSARPAASPVRSTLLYRGFSGSRGNHKSVLIEGFDLVDSKGLQIALQASLQVRRTLPGGEKTDGQMSLLGKDP
jgi:hypothetical protein